MDAARTQGRIVMAAGLSDHRSAVRAAEHACERCAAGLGSRAGGGPADLVVLLLSHHHLEAAQAIATIVRKRLATRCLIGVSASAVLGGGIELEETPGVSLLAMVAPGVRVKAFRLDELDRPRSGNIESYENLALGAGIGPEHRGTILLADPFSVAMNTLLPALSRLRSERGRRRAGRTAGTDEAAPGVGPILGGLASAARKPGGNVLILNDEVTRRGGVGVSLSGGIRVDSLVSHGCRPFGPIFVVTGAKGQIVTTLSGRPALQALHEAIESLSEQARQLLRNHVFLGRAINEYKPRFGRGDFLVRHLIGVDQDTGAVVVADLVRVGQTVQFHLRDPATADEDLGLLLDGQKLHDPPLGALLFTCNERGRSLFSTPHHDAAAVTRAFGPEPTAEDRARAGVAIGPEGPEGPRGGRGVPLAGFFAAGEIGPVGDEVFLHGHTASLAIFRDPA
ncbi:MAG TPA: FIST N-terminal domain-containing protein [Phycisphaerales bacterium]|nr:FIST N-terminal domain-containing protein [Phycisphaerales bacterium]